MNTLDKLVKYGLNKAEATVYLDVLANLDSSAFAIYKRVSLPKTSVYHILEALKKRGLISTWRKNNIAYFSAESPKKLTQEVREKEDLLQSLLPDLLSLTSKNNRNNSVKMYEGGEGLKAVMRDSLDYCAKNNINSMLGAATDSLSQAMPKFLYKWIEEREKMNIFVKMLVPKTNTIAKGLETNLLRETRFLPADFVLPGIINVYGGRVELYSIKEDKLSCIVIDSPAYTDLLRNFFLLIWNTAERVK